MSVEAQPVASRPYGLMIIDEDPVFRLGLQVWLERYADLSIIAAVETGEAAQHWLAENLEQAENLEISLAILDIKLGRSHPDRIQGLTLCQRLRADYPTLQVLILSATAEPLLGAAAQQAGAAGYCPKNIEPESLANILRRVASGRSFFWNIPPAIPPALLTPTPPDLPTPLSSSPAPLAYFRRSLRQSSLQQIDATLAAVNAELRRPELSLVDRAILAGRQRELRVARKLMDWMWSTPSLPSETATGAGRLNSSRTPAPLKHLTDNRSASSLAPGSDLLPDRSPNALETVSSSENALVRSRRLQSVLFDTVLEKLQSSLDNGTETPMEIDILREEKKRELLYLVLRQLENSLGELHHSAVQPEQLESKRSTLLNDLWQAVTTEFFGKYYTLTVDQASVEVVAALLEDVAIVQLEILNKIPGVVELLKHLLFQMPLAVDSVPYAPGNPEALGRAGILTENLIIQLANAVLQPLLNRFASVEGIKQTLYSRKLLSNREIERFRNDLSWKYRMEKYFREPQNIFESQYSIYVLSWKGIQKTSIYAPRNPELEELSGIQLAVTLALETRDAIAPRLQSVVSLVGNGVIYVLTEVVGRGLGLIGRGILKGLGNAWQDPRLKR
ncbi:MAG TPA: DUF3685 domain-containing protein [Coleofasciculaceae cyanobacterium]|jgi:DNA-binding NarL/FixJ family response regulator